MVKIGGNSCSWRKTYQFETSLEAVKELWPELDVGPIFKHNPVQNIWTQPNSWKFLPDPTQPIIDTRQLKNYLMIGTTNHTLPVYVDK